MARWNADTTVLKNHTLTQAEDEKLRKHETNYAAVGLAFFPFVLGCFCRVGSQAAKFLCTLAMERTGSAPLSPSDRSHFCAKAAKRLR